ncbi:MAG: hypothetical protein PVG05_07720, partial [Gammaproteobacteria bacterium]
MSATWRTRHLLIAVGLALAVLAVALVLFRVPLASHVLAIYLQKAGIPGQARVTTLGLGGATLEAVSLEEFEADGIDVVWDVSWQEGLVPRSVTLRRPSLF